MAIIRILFILKERNNSYTCGGGYSAGFSSGLFNSANFVCKMLNENGVESKLVEVVDSNFIDKEVFNYRPTHVILEAIFVPPPKFKELTRLHPNVKFIIRNHSEIPFLATEGVALDWLFEYLKFPSVFVSHNSKSIDNDFVSLLASSGDRHEARKKIIYLPNYYPHDSERRNKKIDKKAPEINIGCFGAIRILKNQFAQAVAAIRFADQLKKKLKFHLNGTRIENASENALKNIRALFKQFPQHELIEHKWLPHHKFLQLIDEMDLCMQVSFSETFNIICADTVSRGVAVIASPEVKWLENGIVSEVTNTDCIIEVLTRMYHDSGIAIRGGYTIADLNKESLKKYSQESKKIWLEYFCR